MTTVRQLLCRSRLLVEFRDHNKTQPFPVSEALPLVETDSVIQSAGMASHGDVAVSIFHESGIAPPRWVWRNFTDHQATPRNHKGRREKSVEGRTIPPLPRRERRGEGAGSGPRSCMGSFVYVFFRSSPRVMCGVVQCFPSVPRLKSVHLFDVRLFTFNFVGPVRAT